jgi:hypothetical protein
MVLTGRALLATVTTVTSAGFLLIGFDNGLMGDLGTCLKDQQRQIICYQCSTKRWIVNGPAFNDFFDHPSSTMIGLIVAIYEGNAINL